jgi:hypothetical protein
MSLTTKMASTVAVAAMILCIWYLVMAALFRVTEQAPAALVFFPGRYLQAQNLPQGISILKWTDDFAILSSDEAGYVAKLYAAGFPVVFPARSSGCFSYRS